MFFVFEKINTYLIPISYYWYYYNYYYEYGPGLVGNDRRLLLRSARSGIGKVCACTSMISCFHSFHCYNTRTRAENTQYTEHYCCGYARAPTPLVALIFNHNCIDSRRCLTTIRTGGTRRTRKLRQCGKVVARVGGGCLSVRASVAVTAINDRKSYCDVCNVRVHDTMCVRKSYDKTCNTRSINRL